MHLNIDDQSDLSLVDYTPDNDKRYRARFYLNADNLTMAAGDELLIFFGDNTTSEIVQIWLRDNAGTFEVETRTLEDDGTTWVSSGCKHLPQVGMPSRLSGLRR